MKAGPSVWTIMPRLRLRWSVRDAMGGGTDSKKPAGSFDAASTLQRILLRGADRRTVCVVHVPANFNKRAS